MDTSEARIAADLTALLLSGNNTAFVDPNSPEMQVLGHVLAAVSTYNTDWQFRVEETWEGLLEVVAVKPDSDPWDDLEREMLRDPDEAANQ